MTYVCDQFHPPPNAPRWRAGCRAITLAVMIIVLLLLAWPTPEELKASPDVAAVQVRAAEAPTHRVIHILDWHYVPQKRFGLDTPDGDYDAFLDDVEALQQQQRALIKAMGVKQVHLEGLTAKSSEHYRQRVETLKKYKPPKGDDVIALFVARLRREDSLQLDAPGAMLIAGELEAVLPADDPDLHAAAKSSEGREAGVRRSGEQGAGGRNGQVGAGAQAGRRDPWRRA